MDFNEQENTLYNTMWILPNNHPLYSEHASECVESKEDLKEHAFDLIGLRRKASLMWRSKPSPLGTWLKAWNKVYWIPHLFGRTLKPSAGKRFEEKLTLLLEDTPASRFLLQESSKAQKIQDTSGPTMKKASGQFNLWDVSSKTSETTSTSDTNRLNKAWKDWVMKLGKEYTQRKKWALLTKEIDYSSSRWPTPTSNDSEKRGNPSPENGKGLKSHVLKWGTPRVPTNNGMGYAKFASKARLEDQVKLWTTPSSRDWKDTPGMTAERKDGKNRLDQLPRQVFHWDRDMLKENGKNLVLNPSWVIQLMGTTLQETFCEWQEIQ